MNSCKPHTVVSMPRLALLALSFFPGQIACAGETILTPVPAEFAQCSVCHGVELGGNFATRGPRISGLPIWYVTNQLESFKRSDRGWHETDIPGLEMQSIAARLTDEEMRPAAEYVFSRESPLPQAIFGADPQVGLVGNSQRGRALYSSCTICHGSRGEGNSALQAPPLTIQNDWYLVTQLRYFRSGLRGGKAANARGAEMHAALTPLKDDQSIVDVIAYVSGLARVAVNLP